MFGGVPAVEVVVSSSTSLEATVPDVGTEDTLDVVVITAGGLRTDPTPYEVVSPKPLVTSVRPRRIIVGRDTSLTVEGQAFLPVSKDESHQPSLMLGGRPLAVTSSTGSKLIATIPSADQLALSAGDQELVAVDNLGRESDATTLELVDA